jgi:putative hydrolase of the HAD superfamily
VRTRAVVFDLWETLVDWPRAESEVVRRRWSELLDITLDELDRHWYDPNAYRLRESGPLAPAVQALCAAVGSDLEPEELISLRREQTRKALVPREGVLETLAGLRDRGLRTGLITNCTEDVSEVWGESPLAATFDACVFSSTVGYVKPDLRIYELACEALAVAPTSCLFVGDGANDELGGAARAGMAPVLMHRLGEAPRWNGLSSWSGRRVTSAAQVLELIR